MPQNIEFSEEQLDCFAELMNIAYGSATAAISDIINAFATLNIPKVQILPANKLKSYLQNRLNIEDEQFVATQLLSGDISGENLFLINKSSAINLARGFEVDENELENNDVIYDIVLEVINILSSSSMEIGRASCRERV